MRPGEPRHLEPVLGPRTVSETVRASDFVGRNGGEEFIILLPNTDTQHATAVADKILGAVAAITLPGVERDITASLGIATIPDHAADGDQLVRSADRALYVAKTNGRNRAEVAVTGRYEPEPPSDETKSPQSELEAASTS
jgi:diguanylate cyclase (GGDEF)-like protein